MKRDPGRISIITFDPWENLIQNTITPLNNSTQKFAYPWGIPKLKIYHLIPAELQAGIAQFALALWHKCSY
jgi:hypothetical protein